MKSMRISKPTDGTHICRKHFVYGMVYVHLKFQWTNCWITVLQIPDLPYKVKRTYLQNNNQENGGAYLHFCGYCLIGNAYSHCRICSPDRCFVDTPFQLCTAAMCSIYMMCITGKPSNFRAVSDINWVPTQHMGQKRWISSVENVHIPLQRSRGDSVITIDIIMNVRNSNSCLCGFSIWCTENMTRPQLCSFTETPILLYHCNWDIIHFHFLRVAWVRTLPQRKRTLYVWIRL